MEVVSVGSCYALGLLGTIFGESSDCGSDGVGVEVEVGDQSQGVGNGSHD